MDTSKIESNIKPKILEVFSVLGKKIDINQINIIPLHKGHSTPKFNKGKMYVYSFWFENNEKEIIPLKIGKAGPKSAARYTSHHYNMNSSQSCLAKRISKDDNFITENNLMEISKDSKELNKWIKENCHRIDIEMPFDENNNFDLYTLELVEAIFHNLYKPKYEGITEQEKNNSNND